MSKSDPQVHVSLKSKTGQWVEIGRTEVIMDNLNPQWVTPIVVGMGYLHLRKDYQLV